MIKSRRGVAKLSNELIRTCIGKKCDILGSLEMDQYRRSDRSVEYVRR